MIIWWVNQYAVTPDLPGGTRHYDLAVELGRLRHQVRVFASDVNLSMRRRTKLQHGQLYDVEDVNGVTFVWIKSAGYRKNDWRRVWNMISFSWNLLRVARRLRGDSRPDVIIGSSPHPFAALAAAHLARLFGARFILEVRDLWPQALIDMGALRESHPAARVLRRIEHYLYSRADRIIVLAQGTERYLVGRGVQAERIVYVPNGVHLDHFRVSADRQSNRKRFGFDRFTVVYAGAHGPANALDTVVQAARMVRDLPVEFVLVGDGPAKESLLRLVKSTGADNVRFMPPVPKRDVADLLCAADAGVITLRNVRAFSYAVSPNKLFDYMAASLPILCAVAGESAEMVRSAQAGLVVEPENSTGLAEAVRHLFTLSTADREQMGRRGRAFLEANFDRRVLARRLVQALTGHEIESATTGLVV